MNREIKFRVWDKRNHYFLCDTGDFRYLCLGISYEFREISTRPDNFIIQQFTGKTDENGKEIYEGDIISRENQWDMMETAEITFEPPSFVAIYKGYGTTSDLLKSYNYEVIGNVFENPELLK